MKDLPDLEGQPVPYLPVAQIRRMFASLDMPSLRVLVNAAGSYPPVAFLTSTAEDWLTSYALNVVAAVSCTQHAVRLRCTRGSSGSGSRRRSPG